MDINKLNFTELTQYKKVIENKIRKYNKILKSINECLAREDEFELSMPLYYNNITHDTLEHKKSIKYTKHLIEKMIKRKTRNVTFQEYIHVKQEPIEENDKDGEPHMNEGNKQILNGNIMEEEIEMPPLEYA